MNTRIQQSLIWNMSYANFYPAITKAAAYFTELILKS